MKKQLTISMNVDVKIPSVPNFIQCGNRTVSLADFSDEELRTIGKEWVTNLITRAIDIRKAKKK